MFQDQSAFATLPGDSPGESGSALEELTFNPGYRSPGLNNFPMRIASYLISGDFCGDAALRHSGERTAEFLLRCLCELEQAPRNSDFAGYSRRFLAATSAELNADIAKALELCGTCPVTVLLFDNQRRSGVHDDSLDHLHKTVFAPLYEQLRALGYSHRDLAE